jgi:hypothetical protein
MPHNPRGMQIVGSAFAAAAYLRSVGFGAASLQADKVALVLGVAGLHQEMTAAGIPFLTPSQLELPLFDSTDAIQALQVPMHLFVPSGPGGNLACRARIMHACSCSLEVGPLP